MNEILNKDDKKRDSSLGQLTVVLCCTKIFKPNNVAIHTKKNQRNSYYNFNLQYFRYHSHGLAYENYQNQVK